MNVFYSLWVVVSEMTYLGHSTKPLLCVTLNHKTFTQNRISDDPQSPSSIHIARECRSSSHSEFYKMMTDARAPWAWIEGRYSESVVDRN